MIVGLLVRVLILMIAVSKVGVVGLAGVVVRYFSLTASASVVLPYSRSFWYLVLALLPLEGLRHSTLAETVRLSVRVSVLGLVVLPSLQLMKVQRSLGITSTAVVVLP